jgi:pyruvate,water dikinase
MHLTLAQGSAYSRTLRAAREVATRHTDCQELVLLCRLVEHDLFIEAGRRMQARGLGSGAADASCLTAGEILAWLRGGLPDEQATRLLVQRADRARRWARYSPPDEIGAPEPDTVDLPEGGVVLHGMPASRGKATGPARILSGPSHAAVVLPGDVLVCDEPVAGLSPLLAVVSALVAEQGDLLGPGGVLVREYGIPAVFGITGATGRLRDGEMVVVDATHGVVIPSHRRVEWDDWPI